MIERNLVTSLLLYETIRTTRKNAKVIQPIVDRLICDAKKATPYNAIRAMHKVVTDHNASRKVMEVLLKRYANRSSGFTSIQVAGARKGDGAAIVDLMLMDREIAAAPSTIEKKSTKTTKSKKSTKKESSNSSISSDSSVPSQA